MLGNGAANERPKLLSYRAYVMLLNSDKYKGERIKHGRGIWDSRVGMRRSLWSKDPKPGHWQGWDCGE